MLPSTVLSGLQGDSCIFCQHSNNQLGCTHSYIVGFSIGHGSDFHQYKYLPTILILHTVDQGMSIKDILYMYTYSHMYWTESNIIPLIPFIIHTTKALPVSIIIN